MMKILLALVIELLKLLKRYYDNMTPGQREAWQKAIKDVQDPMAGNLEGP
ncbi:MAG: hypothetical protein WC637_00065 [Victivallales bacterium]